MGKAHILVATEQICTVDMLCAEGRWSGRFGGSSGHQIRYRHNFTELQCCAGNSGRWAELTLAKDPTLAGVYSVTRG